VIQIRTSDRRKVFGRLAGCPRRSSAARSRDELRLCQRQTGCSQHLARSWSVLGRMSFECSNCAMSRLRPEEVRADSRSRGSGPVGRVTFDPAEDVAAPYHRERSEAEYRHPARAGRQRPCRDGAAFDRADSTRTTFI